MNQGHIQPAMLAPPQDPAFLIADVAALTGVPAPQLRSWEQAGLLSPRRSPNATRLYSVEDVARVRLIKRSLANPGRRGSLRRLAAQFAAGTLQPAPEDYIDLPVAAAGPAPLTDAAFWQAAVNALAEPLVVCDTGGHMVYANPALQAMLPPDPEQPFAGEGQDGPPRPSRSRAGAPLPVALEALPLRWAARTGTYHRDVPLLLRGPDGAERRLVWTVTPLRDAGGSLHGAVGLGRPAAPDPPKTEDWLVAAAHDLRNPVTNILGRVGLARRVLAARPAADAGVEPWRAAADSADSHLAVAELSIADLIRSMETLFDAAAIANGALLQRLEPGGVAIDLIAHRAVERARLYSNRHTFELEVHTSPLLVAGDRVRLAQVFAHLLANAVTYAPDGGPITVQLDAVETLPSLSLGSPAGTHAARGWVLLRIADTGLGIRADTLPHVFDPYWRSGIVTQRIAGMGLGLYTCRAIVEAHGGHIWVEDTATIDEAEARAGRHGTVMAFALPLAPPDTRIDAEG